MKKSTIRLFLLLYVCLAGCVKKKKILPPLSQTTQLHVIGIECADCVKLAVKKISLMHGISSVHYTPDCADDYEPGVLTIVHTPDWNQHAVENCFKKLGFEIIE